MTGSPPNARLQERIETVIRVLAPVLDLVIAAGERTSRLLDRGGGRPYAPPIAPDHQLAAHGAGNLAANDARSDAEAPRAQPARH